MKLSRNYPYSKTNNVRKIIILTKKAFCHIHIGELEQAEKEIQKVKMYLKFIFIILLNQQK